MKNLLILKAFSRLTTDNFIGGIIIMFAIFVIIAIIEICKEYRVKKFFKKLFKKC